MFGLYEEVTADVLSGRFGFGTNPRVKTLGF
jgi:hypothetical protein